MIKVAPSILAADFSKLGDELRHIEAAGADLVHVDVMDGIFVPQATFGPPIVKAIRHCSDLPFDVHLMQRDPTIFIGGFADAGADMITVHVESGCDTKKAMRMIRDHGKSPGISLNPGTPVKKILKYIPDADLILVMSVQPGYGGQAFRAEALPKISAIREYSERERLCPMISVDGGINRETGLECANAGADILVAGSYLFGHSDMESEIALWKGFGRPPAE